MTTTAIIPSGTDELLDAEDGYLAVTPDTPYKIPGDLLPTSLVLPEGMSFADWEQAGVGLRVANRAMKWWLGDWIAYGEDHYGEMYSQAVDDTGYAVQTLMNCVWVCRAIPPARRHASLSFSHHALVAKLPPLDAYSWLDQCESNRWSLRDFKAALKAALKAAEATTENAILAASSTKSKSKAAKPAAEPEVEVIRQSDAVTGFVAGLNMLLAWTRPAYREELLEWVSIGDERGISPNAALVQRCRDALQAILNNRTDG